MKEKWRKELKYTISGSESILLASRLAVFLQRDTYAGKKKRIFDPLAVFRQSV